MGILFAKVGFMKQVKFNPIAKVAILIRGYLPFSCFLHKVNLNLPYCLFLISVVLSDSSLSGWG